jgi:hypothetical protein
VLRDAVIVAALREVRRHALGPPDRGSSCGAVAAQSRQRQLVPRRRVILTKHDVDERVHEHSTRSAGRPSSKLDDADEDG